MTATPERRKPGGRKKARCPVCRQPETARFSPFCSRRCADADLVRWLDGTYMIPDDEPVIDEDDNG